MKTFLKLILLLSFSFISCSDDSLNVDMLQSNWIELESETADDLNHITFHGNSFGIISGDLGTLLKVNISGNTINFENLNLEFDFPVPQVRSFIVDQDNFFTLKKNLYRTIDGGKIFDLFMNHGANSIVDMYFFDPNTGLITLAGRIFKTEDGGANWTEVVQKPTLNKLQFVNNNVGFLYGGFTNGGISGNATIISSGGISKTSDGGQTWADLNLTVPEISALYFVDADTGYFSTTAFDGKFYKTIDGGTTWNLASEEIEGLILEIVFLDKNNGFALTHEGRIYRTADGGNNWSVDYETTNGLNLLSMAKTSGNQLFAVGENGLILKREN